MERGSESDDHSRAFPQGPETLNGPTAVASITAVEWRHQEWCKIFDSVLVTVSECSKKEGNNWGSARDEVGWVPGDVLKGLASLRAQARNSLDSHQQPNTSTLPELHSPL